jgi:hypothetical protein
MKTSNGIEMYYVYLGVGNQFVTYNNGHFGKCGYYLTDDLDKAYYFGCVPTEKHLLRICDELNISRKHIQVIPDEHYETGLSNIRKIIYKRNNW